MVIKNSKQETIKEVKVSELVIGLIGILFLVISTSVGGTWVLVTHSSDNLEKHMNTYFESQRRINDNLTLSIAQLSKDLYAHNSVSGHKIMLDRVNRMSLDVDKIMKKIEAD